MPVRRGVRKRAVLELSAMQWLELTCGLSGESAFADDAERQAAWRAHRDQLLADPRAGHRPAAWWMYEASASRDPNMHETLQLLDLGVLGETEREQVKVWWRRCESVARLQACGADPWASYDCYRRWAGVPTWFAEPDEQGTDVPIPLRLVRGN